MTRSQVVPALLAAAVLAVTAGCTGGAGSGGASSSSTTAGAPPSTASATPGLVRADATDSPPPPRPAAASTASGLARGDDELYAGGDGGLSWEVWLPVFTSGPADAVNRKVRASADYGVAAAADAGALTITGTSEVVTDDGRTVQVRIVLTDLTDDDVEPVDSVTTVALEADDAAPVFLDQQLADPGAAWRVLAQEAGAAAAEQGYTAERPLEATAAQFADWQTSGDGLELSFQRGEFGPGAPVVVVPWRVVAPLLTPEGEALLAP